VSIHTIDSWHSHSGDRPNSVDIVRVKFLPACQRGDRQDGCAVRARLGPGCNSLAPAVLAGGSLRGNEPLVRAPIAIIPTYDALCPHSVRYDGVMFALAATNPGTHVALIYARVSQDDDHKERSVKEQVNELIRWANDEGWTIGTVIEDNDRSASTFATRERKGWRQVKSIIGDPRRAETILLTWENSRASRDIEESVKLINMCAETGMFWGYSETVYDLRKPNDKARALHDAVDSQKESELTSMRVGRSMKHGAAQGKPHGRVPYGYRVEYVYNPDTRKPKAEWLVDSTTAPIVQEMASRFLTGESLRSIASDFERRNVPTSTGADSYGWQAYMIRRILMNPSINGKRKHKGKAFADAQWSAIVDDVTFARIQARFSDPSRKSIRQREVTHLLTGVARCGICDGPMGFAFKRYKDGRERGIYSCRMGNHVARHQLPLEGMVVSHLIDHMRSGDLTNDDPAPDYVAKQEQIAAWEADKVSSKVRATNDPNYSMTDHMDTVAILNQRISDLQRSIKIRNIPTVAIDMADSDDPATYWQALHDAGRTDLQREILRATLRVRVHPVQNHGSHRFDRDSIEIVPIY
jgi:site-specific DNA recombinase